MSEPFDPYYQWLGIPPQKQPPDHYCLLAIEPFEANPDVIERAADRQMAHLRTFQTGPHGELSQKLLNEVAAARLCLLNPQKKAAYDARLRQQLAAKKAKAAPKPRLPQAKPLTIAPSEPEPLVRTDETPASLAAARKRRTKLGPVVTAVAVGLLLVVGLIVWGLGSGEGPSEQAAVTEGQDAPDVTSSSPAGTRQEGRGGDEDEEPPATEPEPAPSEQPLEVPADQDRPEPAETKPPETEPVAAPEPEPAQPAVAEPPATEPQQPEPEAEKKPAVPSEAAQEAARKLICEVYAEEYENAKTDATKQALAKTLLGKALEAQDLAGCYVLLDLARDIATGASDGVTAFQAIAEIDRRFQVDAVRMKASVIFDLTKKARRAAEHRSLAERSIELTDRALWQDDFELAKNLGEMALSEARNARNKSLIQQCQDRLAAVGETAKLYDEVKVAARQLETNPADPEANLRVGRYRCFVKGDWESGLPMLALGSDAKLKALAAKELEGISKPTEQVDLGDGWSALAEGEGPDTRGHLLGRAYHWYDRAISHLAGLEKDRVQKKMGDIRATGLLKLHVPKDAQEFMGHYYKLFPTLMTLHLARDECERLGGYLVRVESPQEQDFVFRLAGGSGSLHVDGSDEVHEGVWAFSNGAPMQYMNWGPGSPDNHRGVEHAVEFSSTGYWNDNSAAIRRPFVCEWEGACNRVARRPTATRKIPRGTVRFQGHRYLRVDTPATWHVARTISEVPGGHLARVESAEEEQFIKKLVAGGNQTYYWLDGSDEAVEGDWRFSDGKEVSYKNWYRGQPNNGILREGRVAQGNEHSLCISKTGQWHDGLDGCRYGFICEWDD